MNTRLPISLLAAIALCTGSVLSFAEDAATPDVAELLRSGEILSQDAIMKRATEQHPGKVTEVELEHKCGRYIYEIDVVDDKGVKTELELDAKSGDVLSSRGDEDEDQEKNNSEKDDDDDD